MTAELSTKILLLEESLLSPRTRRNAAELAGLIADDFIEYGNSGRVYQKDDIIRLLPEEETRKMEIMDFHARSLSPEVVLCSYRLLSRDEGGRELKKSRRNSIWRFTDGSWKIVFHKGVKI